MGSGSVSTLRSEVLPGPTGPKDVLGGVHVRVLLVAAGTASEQCASPVPRVGVPTLGAPKAGVARVYRDDAPTSFFRFVGDHGEQGSPPGVVNGSVEAGLGEGTVGFVRTGAVRTGFGPPLHVGDDEGLRGRSGRGRRRGPAESLWRASLPAVGDPSVGGGQGGDGLAPAVGAALLRGHPALGPGQPLARPLERGGFPPRSDRRRWRRAPPPRGRRRPPYRWPGASGPGRPRTGGTPTSAAPLVAR